eukprot:CAMPEP_0184659246 /NCGR_PEP_ID=MMETSP0308-20130426/28998_1 /TAXON_ID=38269 /ORGANISM="Gloeochaete witrockiana, Strain SAG 46.84" /LENGTH=844 /DNA_ID=CAMNT_0027098935 /DNA_START=328 /DNA_END=2859 /DNA_ORIENTATION=-
MAGPYAAEYRWTQSGSVANFLGFEKVDAIELPIVINLIFIGFQGDGNHGMNLTVDMLRPWFEHVDHVLTHMYAPIAKEMGTTASPVHTSSHVRYTFEYNVLELSSAVTAVLEEVLRANVRPVDPNTKNIDESTVEEYQVEVHRVLSMLNDLLDSLEIPDYTLFILNPHSPTTPAGKKYGYRSGFSDAEITMLRGNKELVSAIETSLGKISRNTKLRDWSSTYREDFKASMPHKDHAPYKVTGDTLQHAEYVHDSEKWAQRFRGSDLYRPQTQASGDPRPALELLAWDMLRGTDEIDHYYLFGVHTNPMLTETCMVDNWISSGRFAFIDLTAGPYQWGPVVGGEGVRTPLSFPRAAAASVASDPVRVFEKIARHNDREIPHDVKSLKEEKEVVLTFLARFCEGKEQIPLCTEIVKRLEIIQSILDGQGLSNVGDYHEDVGEVPEAVNAFLAKLAAAMSSFIRHVVTPATPALPFYYSEKLLVHLYVMANHAQYDPLDPTYFDVESFKKELIRYQLPSQQIVFAVHKIKMSDDPALAMAYSSSFRTAVVPTLNVEGQFEATKRVYVDSLLLQNQLRQLASRVHAKTKDAAKKDKHTTEEHDSDAGPHYSAEVPIFLFSVDFSLPVLVDKYYQSRALKDMVIAVQSDHSRWDSGQACNGKPIYWNLRDPMRSVLLSTLGHIAGLLPTHYTFGEAQHRVSQDWTWSVGDQPSACTTYGYHFSQFQLDSAHRSHVVSGLDRSLYLLNAGVQLLSSLETKTKPENYAFSELVPAENLTNEFLKTTDGWELLSTAVLQLDFNEATYHLGEMLMHAQRFKDLAQQVKTSMAPYMCKKAGTETRRKASSLAGW